MSVGQLGFGEVMPTVDMDAESTSADFGSPSVGAAGAGGGDDAGSACAATRAHAHASGTSTNNRQRFGTAGVSHRPTARVNDLALGSSVARSARCLRGAPVRRTM